MYIIAYIVLAIYLIALIYITCYCLLQFQLLFYYKRFHRLHKNDVEKTLAPEEYPFVTIQLPIFNEMYVMDRLLDNIVKMDYPKDRYEIQVLDDSTDETVQISKKGVARLKARGYNVEYIHRIDRSGYKAGALKAAMSKVKGEFIAIFDADFLPRPDFLKRTLPSFENDKVGVVQTRWEHINEDYSLLTRLQAMQLNVHFTVEQSGRFAGDCLLQFNGTAGVWRKTCIEDAGGWEADTLTEDLDLSYRAQLKGWEVVFLEKVAAPAELPAEMNGLKSQQFRWMKGGAENAKKLLPAVWKSDMSFHKKLHASSHLLASTVYIFIFLAGVFSVPLLFAIHFLEIASHYFAVFLLGLLSVVAVYYVANVQTGFSKDSMLKTTFKFIILFPVFLALSMGLSLHNTIAVLQGYQGKKSPFIRTPKFNIKSLKDSFEKRSYLASKISWTTIFEGVFSVYFLGGVAAGIYLQDVTFLLFHILLAVGYGSICFYSVKHISLK